MKDNIYKFSPNLIISNSKYLHLRSKLLNLLRQVSSKMCFKSQTYFLSIYYLDIIHLKYQKINLDLKLLSLSCLLLSAKYAENDQNVPNLPIFVAIFNSFVEYRDIITSKEYKNTCVLWRNHRNSTRFNYIKAKKDGVYVLYVWYPAGKRTEQISKNGIKSPRGI
jgi:hypothetical protein